MNLLKKLFRKIVPENPKVPVEITLHTDTLPHTRPATATENAAAAAARNKAKAAK